MDNYVIEVCSCNFLSKDDISPNISGERPQQPELSGAIF